MAAWWNPDPAVAALLLDRGAQIDARTTRDYTPLHGAARYNRLAVVSLLVDHGADIKAGTHVGSRPLHYGVGIGDPAVASLLMGLGADVNARSTTGTTPLHRAAAYARIHGRYDVTAAEWAMRGKGRRWSGHDFG